ncbi:MAG TPA: PQQ-binding-like beta-propeller repeat protein, partial [Verrucomicrobiales bacterium]|nr:PQQ-binding-like beta-propeller repeat protein [Verrucomicrobiales bacterium]
MLKFFPRFPLHLLLPLLWAAPVPAADWPQWMGPARDGVWREEGLCGKFPEGGPKVLWEAKCGKGYAGPAVAGGRVFLPDRLPPEPGAAKPAIDHAIPGTERLLCLDAASGRTLWEYKRETPCTVDYPAGPRATPTVHDGFVYFLGIQGRLACLEAATGNVVWEREIEKDYKCKAPMWGFAAHPLVYKDMLICLAAGEGSCLLALDLKTGKERWKALTVREPGYSPPTLCDNHGRPLLIQWTGGAVFGVDPDTGRELWSIPWPIKYGVSIAAPRQQGDMVLVSSYWSGSKMLRLQPGDSRPEIVWETEKESATRTTHLNALMCTPVLRDGCFYGVCSYGQLRGLKWDTGARCWENRDIVARGGEVNWGTAFLTQMDRSDRFLCFTEHGELLILRLTPERCEVISRAKVIEPDCPDVKER